MKIFIIFGLALCISGCDECVKQHDVVFITEISRPNYHFKEETTRQVCDEWK